MDAAVSDPEVRALRAALLAWYRTRARDLPWRRTKDPYAIWVSEVMLQQTRVDTVRPYYERFLARWPSVRALAAADPDEVRAAWSGLGYYRRARAMLDAAETMVERHGGELPSDPEALAALPGFGPYTTGAVAAIAFDRPVPAVDGNVARVLARLFHVEGDVTKGAPAKAVRERAARLMPGEAPGELAQALIELGALVCKRNPACGECPVRARCAAKEAGRASAIPPARARRAPTRVALTALVLADAEGVVLTLRPDDGLFGGMWCPPLVEGHPAPAKAAELAGLPGLRLEPSGDVRHLLTHRALETRVLAGAAPRELPAGLRKVAFERLDERGLPSFATKLLRAGAPLEHLPERLPGRDRERPSQLPLFEGGRRE